MDKSKWEVENKTFGEVFNLFMGRTPSRDNDSYWLNGKYEWLSIGDMGDSKYLSTTKEKISEEAIVNMQVVPENTVVMSSADCCGVGLLERNDCHEARAVEGV